MEAKKSKQASSFVWIVVAAMLSQSLVIPVMCAANFDDQKNYYSPDPNARTPPPVSISPPPHGSGGGHATPTPSHGTPSHGGTPPANCGNPPSGGHHRTTPSPPTGSGGRSYRPPPTSTPTTPTTPRPTYRPPPTSTPTTPTTPTPTYRPPPTSTPTTPTTPTPTYNPPTTPTTPTPTYNPPTTPTTPTPTYNPPTTPTTPTPVIVSPPTTPIITPGTPSTPGITIPSPPFAFDPNSPPFTCIYWRNHPTLIWGLFGWWGTIGSAFGMASLPGIGANTNLLQALSNTRTDGLGELYREGTAALLNSMIHTRFPYTTSQVRDSFVAALSSNKAAAAQAQIFKQANEGRTKPRA